MTDRLEENFRELMSYDFTAHMEDGLDRVASAQADWKVMLDGFFSDFSQQLEVAEKPPEEGDASQSDGADLHCLPDL